MIDQPATLLREIFEKALAAAMPKNVLGRYLPVITSKGRVVVLGAGKAAGSMAAAFEKAWTGDAIEGLAVTRYGHKVPTEYIEVLEAAHPVPDQAGLDAAKRILKIAESLGKDDTLVCLISGGGSALLTLPQAPVSIEEKQVVNKALLASGAGIHEINCVRKHMSAIKGGRLACAAYPARVITLAISDVTGDDPGTIASGPTVKPGSTPADALAIIGRYGLKVPDSVMQVLQNAKPLSWPDDLASEYHLIARPMGCLRLAAEEAEKHGLNTIILGDNLETEARYLGKVLADIAASVKTYDQPIKRPALILSGGEATVTIAGKGRGGPNTELLLSMALSLRGEQGIYAIACDTDGVDGSEDNAGAVITPETFERAREKGLDLEAYLKNNDAYSFFEALGDLVITGPSLTNVNDFRAILVL